MFFGSFDVQQFSLSNSAAPPTEVKVENKFAVTLIKLGIHSRTKNIINKHRAILNFVKIKTSNFFILTYYSSKKILFLCVVFFKPFPV